MKAEVDLLLEHDSTILALLVREVRQYEGKYRVKVQKGKDVPLLISLYKLAADKITLTHTIHWLRPHSWWIRTCGGSTGSTGML